MTLGLMLRYDLRSFVLHRYATLALHYCITLQMMIFTKKMCVENDWSDIASDLHRVVEVHRVEYKKGLVAEAAALKARQDKCVALAMGHHLRLGAGSIINRIDPEVLRIVIATAGLRKCCYV